MTTKPTFFQVLRVGWAKNGTGHWWLQRLTAIALIPLSYFVIRLFDVCSTLPYPQAVAWVTSPLNSIGLAAWLILVFYHAALGLQVVIEDYMANPVQKNIALWGVNISFLLLCVAALWAVVRLLSVG